MLNRGAERAERRPDGGADSSRGFEDATRPWASCCWELEGFLGDFNHLDAPGPESFAGVGPESSGGVWTRTTPYGFEGPRAVNGASGKNKRNKNKMAEGQPRKGTK